MYIYTIDIETDPPPPHAALCSPVSIHLLDIDALVPVQRSGRAVCTEHRKHMGHTHQGQYTERVYHQKNRQRLWFIQDTHAFCTHSPILHQLNYSSSKY